MTGAEHHAWETGLMDTTAYVGLDVHKGTISVALAESGRGGEVRGDERGDRDLPRRQAFQLRSESSALRKSSRNPSQIPSRITKTTLNISI